MNTLFLLFHGKLHLSNFILDGTSRFYREATSTPATSIDFIAGEDPLLSSPCHKGSLKKREMLLHERYSKIILFDHVIHKRIKLLFYFDLMSCTTSIGYTYGDTVYMSLFPRDKSFWVKAYHIIDSFWWRVEKIEQFYFFSIVLGRWGRYFHTPSFQRAISQPSWVRREGIVCKVPFCIRSDPSTISGWLDATFVIYAR